MTLQQLKYVLAISETGSMNKAAEQLYVSQPSLTSSVQELEKEIDIKIFNRSGRGVTLTNDGAEFLQYARQVVGQFDILSEKYISKGNVKKKFGVSTQHYSFAVKAFVEMVKEFDTSEYEFAIRETKTSEIISDVATMRSEIGIIYLNEFNRKPLSKLLLGAAYTVDSDDKYALAFPSFGPERRGAPVRAFTKLDTKPVADRSQTEKADYIVILDDTLYSSDLKELLNESGKIIVNSKNTIDGAETFDAEKTAAEFRLPTVNTVMFGLLVGISGVVTEEEAVSSIKGYMPEKIQERNIGALLKAAGEVRR